MGDKYLHFSHLLLHARARALQGIRTWRMPSGAAQTLTHTLRSKPLYEYEIYRKEKSIQMHVRHVVKVLKYSKVNVVGSSFAYTHREPSLTLKKYEKKMRQLFQDKTLTNPPQENEHRVPPPSSKAA